MITKIPKNIIDKIDGVCVCVSVFPGKRDKLYFFLMFLLRVELIQLGCKFFQPNYTNVYLEHFSSFWCFKLETVCSSIAHMKEAG